MYNLIQSLVSDTSWDIAKSALGTGVTAALGLVTFFLYHRRKYGGWEAVLQNGEKTVDVCKLGVGTARDWLTDEWKRKLGLKSLCADNQCFLNINVLKISHVDHIKKQFVIRFEENPPKAAAPKPPVA